MPDNGNKREGMDEWINQLKGNPGQDLPDQEDGMHSREYRQYREAEKLAKQKNWYERLTAFAGQLFKAEPFEDLEEDIDDAIAFLGWRVDKLDIAPASLLGLGATFLIVLPLLFISIPFIFKFLLLLVPIAAFMFLTFYPMIAAKSKLITSSNDMIMATLYMVIYMRSSPNIEGAIRFVAQNLEGAIAKDFKRMLWAVQVGTYTSVQEALDDYKDVWFPYNRDFVETLNIIQSALQEGRAETREQLFQEAINNLLNATEHRMKEYSRNLRTPVMFVQGMGVLLPVLLMILFPLIAAFIGGGDVAIYLFAGYNIVLPVVVYLVMQQVILSRPPTTTTTLVDNDNMPKGGRYPVSIGETTYNIPLLPFCIGLFLLIGFWPMQHYLGILFGSATLASNPGTFEIFRSIVMTLSVSIPTGLYLTLGFEKKNTKQVNIKEIEEEFPQALYMLGDALGRGSPIEIAIDDAIKNMQGMDITSMFEKISQNIRSMSMTFDRAIFDRTHGVLKEYPSKLIESIMKAIRESSGKGTAIVSSAMKTISSYLKRVKETQQKIEDMMSDTLSTMTFISYVLAPVISGIAVGMGMIITNAFSRIGESFSGIGNVSDTGTQVGGGGPVSGIGGGAGGAGGFNPSEIFSFNQALPPEIIQLVVGLYFIQLAFILGTFYVKLSKGENLTTRNITVGRILLVGSFLYAVTVLVLTSLFGAIISGVGGGV